MGRGEITVRKRGDGSFEARVHVGWGWKNGKRVRVRKSFYGKRRRDAVAKATAWIQSHGAELPGDARRLTVVELVNAWIEHKRSAGRHRETTTRRHEINRDRFVAPRIGGWYADELRPIHVERFYSEIPGTTQPRHVHELLRGAFNYGVRLGLVSSSPVARVDAPGERRRGATVGGELVELLLGEADLHRCGVAVYLAAGAGLRLGEVLALRWRDVDTRARSLRVVAGLRYGSGLRLESGPTKTASSAREIPISAEVADSLRRRRKRALAEGHAGPDSPVVCTVRRGGLYSPSGFYRDVWGPIRRAAGAPAGTRFHGLRHAAASRLIVRDGVDPETAGRLLGHADASVTLRTYTHADDRALREAVERGGGIRGVDRPKNDRGKKGGG